MNWILDNYAKKYDIIFFTDDDIKKIGRVYFGEDENKPDKADWEEVKICLSHMKFIADKIGAKIGGFSCLENSFDKMQMGGGGGKFALIQKKYIDGKAFIIYSDDGTRYDEELYLKEDIAFNCESLLKNKRTLSVPFVCVSGKALVNKGGVCDVRTMDLEIEHARKLIYKYGDMVRPFINKKTTKGVRSQPVQLRIE